MAISLSEFKANLILAHQNNTLIIEKHNPHKLLTTFPKYRTVVAELITEQIFHFIDFGIENVLHYTNQNSKYFNSSYFEVIPKKDFAIASSGIIGNATTPYEVCDRLVALNSLKKGWHIYGEKSELIKQKYILGELTNQEHLK